jgi:serine/threonine protein kinase
MERDEAESIGSMAIGKYQIFASLGRGGMADVFLAVARGPMGFNKLTVIKRLRADLAADPSFANMLLDEARLAARLSHPNVVHTYEVGEENGVYFIAMEYLEGQPLVRIARTSAKYADKKLTAPFAARIIADALSGLHYAHELRDYDGTSLKIIHRDVSPHNIFVTYDGVVKIMDFGIAKAASSATQTEVGVLKGKLAYMAPEQVMSDPVDRRADIFAMGIVLWELLTGERLFNSAVAAAAMHKLLTQPIPRVSEKLPDIDPKLDALVAKALEKKPENRFQTAHEMRNALEDYIAASGTIPRQDEIGRRVSELFEDTRENVKRQIQVHMAQVSLATSTGELMMLNASALKRVSLDPTPSGKNLLSLAPSPTDGSGSDVGPAANPPSLAGETNPRRKRAATVVAVLLLLVVLFGVGFAKLRVPHGPPPVGSGEGVAASAGAPVSAPGLAGEGRATPPQAPVMVPPVTAPAVQAPTANVPVVATAPTTPSPPAVTAPAAQGAPAHHDHSGSAHAAGAPPPTPPKPAVPAPAAPTAPAAAPADVGTGYLTLDTYPWTRVSENGRVLGTTPLVHVALSAGTHVLTLENPEQGLKQQYPVTLKADESVSRRLGLK